MAHLISLLLLSGVVQASLPLVDFDRMGRVGLAGSFAGFDLFQNNTAAFDPSTSTLLSRSQDGDLVRLGSTNSGGKILAGCVLNNVLYFAGSFSSINSVTAQNIVSYTPSNGQFASLASGGPDGEIDTLFCDDKNNKVWAGGKFTTPASAVAVWDAKGNSWSKPPFGGLSGADARVLSITENSTSSSLLFAGSFVTSFSGSSVPLNGTNNPNVPFSTGATSFSSSLVPIPLQHAEVNGAPESSDPAFQNVQTKILCPAGNDGPGNTWLGADGTTSVITARAFSFLSVNGIRLGNTFLPNFGTKSFTVTTIPDNTVQTLHYLDPATQQNKTCSDPCPLSTDSSVLYQDFLFDQAKTITGVLVKLIDFNGQAPGLHIFQLLSSGAFASALPNENGQSCFAPNPSNTSQIGTWKTATSPTNISGTTQQVLVSTVKVGTSPFDGPSFRWQPYVSASGNYDINILIPGCNHFQDCERRTSVKVIVFPGGNLDPVVNHVPQTNQQDASVKIYSGPILPTTPDFTTTVQMMLDDNPVGQGQNGNYELVADRIQLVLTSSNPTSGSSNGTSGSAGTGGAKNGFGFFEFPLNAPSSDATKLLPNTTISPLDAVGFNLFSGVGVNQATTDAVAAVVQHSSGALLLGGSFSVSGGSKNVALFRNSAIVNVSSGGLNGGVSSLAINGDIAYIGGSFTDTAASSNAGLKNVAMYDIAKDTWSSLGFGVDGHVTSVSFANNQVQFTGNFTKILTSQSSNSGITATGLAVWDTTSNSWVNSGGFLSGSLSWIGAASSSVQYVAGNIAASSRFGASGMVFVKNSKNEVPTVQPLGVNLDGSTSTSQSAVNHRSVLPRSYKDLPQIFSKRDPLTPLPATPATPAPAVLAGTFWTNTSSKVEMVIVGGNFSFLPTGEAFGSQEVQGIALLDQNKNTVTGLKDSPLTGTVHTLLVKGNTLYVGGEFTIAGTDANGFAVYDLQQQKWVTGIQPLQAAQGSTVIVRSITATTSNNNIVVAAGSFAAAGSLKCQAACFLDVPSKQWNTLGNGIQGDIAAVAYAGNNQELFIASGSIALSDNTAANVAQFVFSNNSWTAIGKGADIPGPVTAVEVNNGNSSSIFAAGKATDGTSFLTFWNGVAWTTLPSALQASFVSQLSMVPLQNTHQANGVIEPDRMLMVSGSLAGSSFGNVSAALFDGQNFIPYITSTSASGTPGMISALFRSFSTFSFVQRHFLATGIVILISIAIAAGVVFLLALLGILWTLFSRRDDKLTRIGEYDEDDDDSTHHRPSSLLEHINAATRTTIIGGAGSPFDNYGAEKEEEYAGEGLSAGHDQEVFGDLRADTPSEVAGGILPQEGSRPSHARFSFDGAGEGELPLSAGAEVEVLDDRDAAWWYARDIRTGREGVVPAAYLY